MPIDYEDMMNYLNEMYKNLESKFKNDPSNYAIAKGFKSCMNYIAILKDTKVIVKE